MFTYIFFSFVFWEGLVIVSIFREYFFGIVGGAENEDMFRNYGVCGKDMGVKLKEERWLELDGF